MSSQCIVGLIFFLLIGVSFVTSSDSEEDLEFDRNTDWDVLIFTQQWPVTTCFHWVEENEKHKCNLPEKKEFWTIHGIWPTKYGSVGPNFCNKSSEFDIKTLDTIESNLKMFWPNIEKGQGVDSLWKHEWMKHGTCAASITELETEKKYFTKGLEWRDKYLISGILSSSGIHPDSQSTVINIQNAFKKFLDKNPSIHCLYDREKDISYLSEIRICFNKTLDLINCDGVLGAHVAIDYPGGKVITNCHISKPVHYPTIVPPLKGVSWKFPFVNFYKLLNFIMWFTL